MESSDDDAELVSLTDGQAEQFARIEQLWPEFGHSLQVLAASEGGGMGWRTVDGVEYLTRYTQENGKKKGRSLGRRSPEIHAAAYQLGLVFELLLEGIETALMAKRRTFGVDDLAEAYEDRTSQPEELNIFASPAWETIDPGIIFEKENEEQPKPKKKPKGVTKEINSTVV